MTHRIGTKGQVVIPKEIREQAGFHPGNSVDFEFRDGEVVVRKHDAPRPLRGRFAGGPSMTDALLEDRAREPR